MVVTKCVYEVNAYHSHIHSRWVVGLDIELLLTGQMKYEQDEKHHLAFRTICVYVSNFYMDSVIAVLSCFR